MDRRSLLAISICFLIFVAWQKYYIEPRMPKPQAKQAVQTAPSTGATSQAPPAGSSASNPSLSAASPQDTATQVAPKNESVSTQIGDAVVGNGNRFFTGWNLKSYKLKVSPEAAAVDLKSVMNQDGALEFSFDDPAYAYLNQVRGNLSKTEKGALWTYEDSNVKLSREILSSESQAYLDLRVSAEFKAKAPSFAFLSVSSQARQDDPEQIDRQLVYYTLDSLESRQVDDISETAQVSSNVRYIGAADRYFVFTVLPQPPFEPKALIQPVANQGGRISLVFPVTGNSVSIPAKVYFGPKELNTLRSVDPALDHTVDLGFFTFVAYPLLKTLKWFYELVKNYGVAIILLTVLVKLLTFPLTYKSMKSMKKMANLQPQLVKLREKYANDKEALNREMMTLMRTQGYNPMAGCIPILIQMPVFFALYRVLYSSIELYQAPFALWIHDLSAKDPYYVTPVVLSLTMYIQQKLTPTTATDPMQAKMMQFMPLIFGLFMVTLPSGLTLYMLVNAITSIIQQIFMNKKLGMGHAAPAPVRAVK